MRIAIYHNLPSGGGKRALCEVTRRLAESHEIDVYTLSSADHHFCDLRPFCDKHIVFRFKTLPLARRPFGRLNQGIRTVDLARLRALERRIAHQIDGKDYDVVFVHNCQYGQSPGVLSFLATPSVYYCQEPPRQLYEPRIPRPYNIFSLAQRVGNVFDPFPGLYRRTLGRLDRRNVSAADLVLVNSAYSRESLYRTYGIFSRVGYLGVDADHFRPLGLEEEDFVLSVGALRPNKGFDYLIRSLALGRPDHEPRLVIVSNAAHNHEQEYLSQLAASLGVSLSFRTAVPDEELVQLYNRAVLTVYAPVMEPFGLVPLESMACGTPVVGVREAGVRESVVDGVTGLLVDRDSREFAEAIQTLLDDNDRRTRYGQQAQAHVLNNWTWDRSVGRIEHHLMEAAHQHG